MSNGERAVERPGPNWVGYNCFRSPTAVPGYLTEGSIHAIEGISLLAEDFAVEMYVKNMPVDRAFSDRTDGRSGTLSQPYWLVLTGSGLDGGGLKWNARASYKKSRFLKRPEVTTVDVHPADLNNVLTTGEVDGHPLDDVLIYQKAYGLTPRGVFLPLERSALGSRIFNSISPVILDTPYKVGDRDLFTAMEIFDVTNDVNPNAIVAAMRLRLEESRREYQARLLIEEQKGPVQRLRGYYEPRVIYEEQPKVAPPKKGLFENFFGI